MMIRVKKRAQNLHPVAADVNRKLRASKPNHYGHRECVGESLVWVRVAPASITRAVLIVDALEMAIRNRQPPIGTIFHSDRVSQFTSFTFGANLKANGLLGSMSKPGTPADNAAMESFFASLQTELLDWTDWDTRQQLKPAIFHYVEVFYNRRRRHSTFGMISPEEYERRYDQTQAAA